MNEVEMIYFDEFSLSGRHTNVYGWTKIGSKGYIAQNSESFQMGFIVGFSRSHFYGIMGTTNTVDTNVVI